MNLKISECPTCGSAALKLVIRDWSGEQKGVPYVVPQLEFYECPDCGERLYDREAMRKIQAHRPVKVRRRSSA